MKSIQSYVFYFYARGTRGLIIKLSQQIMKVNQNRLFALLAKIQYKVFWNVMIRDQRASRYSCCDTSRRNIKSISHIQGAAATPEPRLLQPCSKKLILSSLTHIKESRAIVSSIALSSGAIFTQVTRNDTEGAAPRASRCGWQKG